VALCISPALPAPSAHPQVGGRRLRSTQDGAGSRFPTFREVVRVGQHIPYAPPEIAESVSVMALIERGKADGQIAGDDVRRAFEADQIPPLSGRTFCAASTRSSRKRV